MRIGAITFRWSVGLRRVSCFLIKAARTASVSSVICGRTFPCRMPHTKSHIPHPTFRIQHSTFSTLLPQIYTFLPVAPRPVSKYAILGAFSQPPNFQLFIVRRSRATFQTLHSPRRNAIFRPSIPALSRLYPLPFAPRYLSPRNPIHAQRPRHPPLTAFPPVPISPPNPKNLNSPPSVSLKIPTQDLRQIFLM